MHHPRIMSSEIARAVQLASAEGNEMLRVSERWTKVRQVVHMKRPLTNALSSNGEGDVTYKAIRSDKHSYRVRG